MNQRHQWHQRLPLRFRGCKQSVSHHTVANHHNMTALCLCVARKISSASPARACMSASIASLSFVVARSSPVPSLALRMGSNDQCDDNQCCPSFGGCLRWHHPGVEPAAQCASTRGNSPVLTHSKNRQTDSSFLISRVVPFSVGRVICLVGSVCKD